MIDMNSHELMFMLEYEGEDYTIGVDKVGGSSPASRYDCEDWRVTIYDDNDDEIKVEDRHICGRLNIFEAAKYFFERIEDGSIVLNNLAEKVHRGVTTLDAIVPRWRELVNTGTLDMSDSSYCVLGQVFYSYNVGKDVLSNYDSDFDEQDYGFDGRSPAEYNKLKELWISHILSNS